jgi:hypothetical protein
VRGRSWVDKGRGKNALFNALVFLSKTFVRACRAMNEEQPESLQGIFKMLGGFALKKTP